MNNERAKILIVDDDAMNRAVLSDLLCDEYDIIEAKDGEEALLILEKNAQEITLVLLDMVMPERDGLEVLAVMNEKGWIKGTPVVMISAETSSKQVSKAFELGPDGRSDPRPQYDSSLREADAALRACHEQDLREDA